MAAALASVRSMNVGLFVQRPTTADLAHRTPIVITSRDARILAAVHRFGFLTTDLIDLAFFSANSHQQSPSTRVYDRLRALWLWGYLERVELPQQRSVPGRLPYLYALGRLGVPHAQRHHTQPVHVRRIDRLDALFVDHDLKAAALWANLRA